MEFALLYDPSHLLKCIRNNFLNKDIEIDFNATNLNEKDRKIASQEHVITAYEIDIHALRLSRSLRDKMDQAASVPGQNKENESEAEDAGLHQKRRWILYL